MNTNATADNAVLEALTKENLPNKPSFLKENEVVNRDAEVEVSLIGTVTKNKEHERLAALHLEVTGQESTDSLEVLQTWEKSYSKQRTAEGYFPWMVGGLLIFAGWLVYAVGKDVFKLW